MTGRHEVIVRTRRLQYKFTLERNLTILKGNSATGKSTLIDMVYSHELNGTSSGVELLCDKECHVLTPQNWQLSLSVIKDSIVFLDEECSFVRTPEFSKLAQESDNYYVIATRVPLPNLPISVTEIYEIKNDTARKISKYQGTRRLYSSFRQINDLKLDAIPKPELVVVEDLGSGFEMYQAICADYGIPCISAGGKSSIFGTVRRADASSVLVIADGAAFGSEIERVLTLKIIKDITVYLPESFEWLILKSGLIKNVEKILETPYDHIESRDYFSWERFFTDLLASRTRGTYLEYTKDRLSPAYLQDRSKQQVIGTMPRLDWE